MGYLIGSADLGSLEQVDIKGIEAVATGMSSQLEIQKMIATTFMANTLEEKVKNEITGLLLPRTKEFPRQDGISIPVERMELYFKKGLLESTAPNFRSYSEKINLKVDDEGYSLGVFDWTDTEINRSKSTAIANNSVNPLLVEANKVSEEADFKYRNKMIPYQLLTTLITGCSLFPDIPPLASPTDGYISSGRTGSLRGELVPELCLESRKNKNVNLYRAIKGSDLTQGDIDDMVDELITMTKFSGQDIIALANTRTVNRLSGLYKDGTEASNKTLEYVTTKNICGVDFIGSQAMHKDFIIFMDSGILDLIIHGVEYDPTQVGLDLQFKIDKAEFNSVEDLKGSRLFVHPNEYFLRTKYSVGILGINSDWQDADGIMDDGGLAEIALVEFVSDLKKSFDFDEKKKI